MDPSSATQLIFQAANHMTNELKHLFEDGEAFIRKVFRSIIKDEKILWITDDAKAPEWATDMVIIITHPTTSDDRLERMACYAEHIVGIDERLEDYENVHATMADLKEALGR